MLRVRNFSNSPRRLIAVHDRHLQVHQNHIERLLLHAFHRLGTIFGYLNVYILPVQYLLNDKLVNLIIFYKQNPRLAERSKSLLLLTHGSIV